MKIVCATRGGQGSRVAQRRAVELARERDGQLIFLNVINFEDSFDAADVDLLRDALSAELKWLANTLMELAQQRATSAGITADSLVVQGDIGTVLPAFMRENNADILIMGAPRGTTDNKFGDDDIERFAVEINAETGKLVEVIRPDAKSFSVVDGAISSG